MTKNPFEFNPFSNKKIDFTKNIPDAPKEIPDRPKSSDEDKINADNNQPEPSKETVIIRKDPA